ncbi:alpha/beta fold hydrolase [Amycolatopsis thermophila]|uniref:Pimeloyl-ACP methyl ester carboxylesterase n=1 Tax=Amycolatopsis thermophila TaxID=206084 RepID=A0ABU0EYV1_9PSEU|nr:alpha/beta hydrolase [Amycolatopsis thermophila]MDQ0380492.1 pimeloyl-ACP methyl ester carboxylesterase [Amycolatopsis thermophila]
MNVTAHHLTLDGRIGFVQDAAPREPNGTTVVLVHTAGQSGVQWRHALRPLTDLGYRLIVPDLPGHGHSEPPAAGAIRDLRDYADWLVRLLDVLAVPRPVVVGCSIGGKIAQDLAARHGARFAAAVSMCAESGPGRAQLHALERELEDSAAASRADRTHLGTRAVVGRRVDRDRAELIARMHCREDPLVSTSDLIGWGTHDVRPLLAGIPCPVTFVAGEDDLWVDPRSVADSARRVPNGRFVLLPGYGHYPMEEMDDFAKVLDAWLAEMKEGRQ